MRKWFVAIWMLSSLTLGSAAAHADAAFQGDGAFGSTYDVKSINLRNTGSGPIDVVSITVSGPPFQIGMTMCGSMLAAGASCAILVEYDRPVGTQPFIGSLTVDYDGCPTCPGTVSLELSGDPASKPIVIEYD